MVQNGLVCSSQVLVFIKLQQNKILTENICGGRMSVETVYMVPEIKTTILSALQGCYSPDATRVMICHTNILIM